MRVLQSGSVTQFSAFSGAATTKVAFISPSFPPFLCGIGDYLAGLTHHLAATGIATAVLTSRSSPPAMGVHPIMPPRWTLANLGPIFQAVERLQPDLLHLQYPTAGYRPGVVAALPWLLKRRFPHLPLCLTLHEWQHERWRSKLEAACAAGVTDALFWGRPSDVVEFRRWAGGLRQWEAMPTALTTIPGSIAPTTAAAGAAIRRELGLAADDLLLVFFGFVRPDKGVDVLLRAFATLCEEMPNLHLALCADFEAQHQASAATLQYREQLRPLVTEVKQRTGRLHHLGFVRDDRRLSAILHASDLGVLPFRNGVYANSTVLMAMLAHHLPVVTTAAALLPELAAALAFTAANDDEGLVQTLRRLLTQPHERAQLRQAAAQWHAGHGWPQAVAEHRLVYTQLGVE